MKRILSISLLLLLSSISGLADIARPEPTKPVKQKKSVATTMTIRMDKDTKEAKLIIPKSQIKQLRAALEDLDNESDATAAAGGATRTQTIVSGMFLSLALVFGGVWFVRSGKSATKSGKALVVIAVIAGLGSAATYIYANAGPPQSLRSISSALFDKKAFSYFNTASGKVNVETSDGTSIELRVPAPEGWPMDKNEGIEKVNEEE